MTSFTQENMNQMQKIASCTYSYILQEIKYAKQTTSTTHMNTRYATFSTFYLKGISPNWAIIGLDDSLIPLSQEPLF